MAADFEKLNQYIWARYIDNAKTYAQQDEFQGLRDMEAYYSKHSLNEDDECFYFGVLLYEMAFLSDDKRLRYLRKAKEVFTIYKEISGEADWDAIEDRLEDITEILKDEGGNEEETDEAPSVQPSETDEGMVLVPAGKFLYGTDKEEKVLEAYLIDVNPVTNVQYGEFLEATNYRKPALWSDERYNQPDQPVVGVSWMDALKYCEWRGKQLPTEEQWEKASRGMDGRTYPWGEDIDPSKTCYSPDGEDQDIAAVGSFSEEASPFGCQDTVGLVWEWTSSSETASPDLRIVKGGSWGDSPEDQDFLSCHARTRAPVKEKNELVGFRCCKAVML